MSHWIDISVPLHPGVVCWPGDRPFEVRRDCDIRTGAEINLSSFSMCAHTGTHIDAPLHYRDGGASLDDLPLEAARDIVGTDTLIGRSTHETGEAARALMEDVDYFCVGPCWPTPTKPGRPAPGLDLVRSVAGMHCDKPWFAIGGIDEPRLSEVLAAGARRIVVVRAITAAADPAAAAGRLSSALAVAG